MEAGLANTRAGAFEGDILAAMQGAVLRGGGDDAGNEFILGSGPRRRCAGPGRGGAIWIRGTR